jgi:alpha-methylacyl-CoA racemase
MMTRQGPLVGVRVVELAGLGPAPYCAMLLADLGADVVRVDRAGATALPMPVLDRGRRSIEVDLKHPDGVDIVRRLAARSDILLEGYRPGVLERLGLAPDELVSTNPRLVVGRMTGFGQDGPLAQRAGHDINYAALSGALAAIGPRGGAPTVPLNLVADFGGGGMLLAVGVLAALHSARATGRGQLVDAAMVEGAASLMSMIYGWRGLGAWSLDRGSNLLDGGAPFYRTYRCADGGYVAVGAIEPEFYELLVEGLGLEGRLDPAGQMDAGTWEDTHRLLEETFATRARDQWVDILHADACVQPVLDLDEAPAHPHNKARQTFVEIDGMSQPAPAPRFSGTPTGLPDAAPRPGRDTDEILAEIGLAGRGDELRSAGAVGGAPHRETG